jgi:hypothetical protein
VELSIPQIQLVIMCVQDAITASQQAIEKAQADGKDISDLDDHLLLLINLQGYLKAGYLKLRERDKSLSSYEMITGGIRFRKL